MRIIRLSFVIAALVSLAALGFMSGCETIGAMGTGRMTKEDVGYIVKAGITGRRSAPVKVESPDLDDAYALSSRPFARWNTAWRTVAKVDPWIEDKLW